MATENPFLQDFVQTGLGQIQKILSEAMDLALGLELEVYKSISLAYSFVTSAYWLEKSNDFWTALLQVRIDDCLEAFDKDVQRKKLHVWHEDTKFQGYIIVDENLLKLERLLAEAWNDCLLYAPTENSNAPTLLDDGKEGIVIPTPPPTSPKQSRFFNGDVLKPEVEAHIIAKLEEMGYKREVLEMPVQLEPLQVFEVPVSELPCLLPPTKPTFKAGDRVILISDCLDTSTDVHPVHLYKGDEGVIVEHHSGTLGFKADRWGDITAFRRMYEGKSYLVVDFCELIPTENKPLPSFDPMLIDANCRNAGEAHRATDIARQALIDGLWDGKTRLYLGGDVSFYHHQYLGLAKRKPKTKPMQFNNTDFTVLFYTIADLPKLALRAPKEVTGGGVR